MRTSMLAVVFVLLAVPAFAQDTERPWWLRATQGGYVTAVTLNIAAHRECLDVGKLARSLVYIGYEAQRAGDCWESAPHLRWTGRSKTAFTAASIAVDAATFIAIDQIIAPRHPVLAAAMYGGLTAVALYYAHADERDAAKLRQHVESNRRMLMFAASVSW